VPAARAGAEGVVLLLIGVWCVPGAVLSVALRVWALPTPAVMTRCLLALPVVLAVCSLVGRFRGGFLRALVVGNRHRAMAGTCA